MVLKRSQRPRPMILLWAFASGRSEKETIDEVGGDGHVCVGDGERKEGRRLSDVGAVSVASVPGVDSCRPNLADRPVEHKMVENSSK